MGDIIPIQDVFYPKGGRRAGRPRSKVSSIDWKQATDQQLYILQYYGKTAAIRKRAKQTLLNRASVKGG